MKTLAFALRSGRSAILCPLLIVALAPVLPAAPPSASPEGRRIAGKLDAIHTSCAFDETSFREAIDFLHLKLIEGDREENAVRKGVNFVDLRAGDPDKAVSLALTDVPAREILKYMCLLAECQYVIEREAVVITDGGSHRNPGGDAGRPSDGSPQSRRIEKFLATEVLEDINLDAADLGDAIEFLRLKLKDASGRVKGAPTANFVIVDPQVAKTPVTLSARNMSVRAALGYLMEKAGAEFTIEKGIITIRKWESPETAQVRKKVVVPPPDAEPIRD